MPRTPLERLRDPRWWGEQALHALGAWPALLVPDGWLLAGAGIGLYVQARTEWAQRPVASWFDLGADLLFAAAGGIAWAALL